MAVSVLNGWTFTDDDDPGGSSLTVSGGTGNRALVLIYGSGSHDISAFGWTITNLKFGDQAAKLEYKTGDSTDDAPRMIAIWGETELVAAGDSTIDFSATVIANDFWGYAVYDGVNQSDLSAVVKDASNNSADVGTLDYTTTSSAGDRIIALGVINSGNRNFTSWDTLSELHDVAAATNNSRYGAAEGDGGDNTTTITSTQSGIPNGATIVLPASGGITPQAMHHYRNHGKFN